MGRKRAPVLALACHPVVVWIGCALGGCLTTGCASPGQLSWSTGQASPPAAMRPENVDQQPNTQNGGSSSTTRPAPHTVGQAWRAYLARFRLPLSERGTGMNAGEAAGDIGSSRYPAAEGIRSSGTVPPGDVDEGSRTPGTNSYPGAGGIRSSAIQGGGPGTRAQPVKEPGTSGAQVQTATKRPRERANPPDKKVEVDRQVMSAKATSVSPASDVNPFPYFLSAGLLPIGPDITSLTGSVCLAATLRDSDQNMYEDVFDSDSPESDGRSVAHESEGIGDNKIKQAGGFQIGPLLAQLGLDPVQTFGTGDEPGNIYERQRDRGLSRYPPAEGERTPLSAGAAAAGSELLGTNQPAWYSATLRRPLSPRCITSSRLLIRARIA